MNGLGAISLLLVIGACTAGVQRGSQPAPATRAADSLSGVVRDSLTDAPLMNAQVFLTDDTIVPPGTPARWSRYTDAVGRFVFRAVQPGSHVLVVRFIGFRVRWLRVTVPQPGGGLVTLRLQPMATRLGHWPPDSAVVARNRERESEWTCQTEEPDVIEFVRKQWIEMFADREPADWDSLLVAHGITRDSAEIARLVRHVTDSQICRRAGRAYDQWLGATDIHFLVFSVGPLLIVANPWGGGGTMLLDQDYRMLWTFVVE